MTPTPGILLASLVLGCAAAGNWQLATAGDPKAAFGELTVESEADLSFAPTRGWDLAVQLDLDWRGQERTRVDLGRIQVRVDDRAWESCRAPPDVDRAALLFTLDPGDNPRVVVHCEDIAEPRRSLEIRFPATNTGSASGTVSLSFQGIR